MNTRQHETGVRVNACPCGESDARCVWRIWGLVGRRNGLARRITLCEPERHLRVESVGSPQVVDYMIQAGAGGTGLLIVHSGFGEGSESDDEYNSTKHGWDVFVRILRARGLGAKSTRSVLQWNFKGLVDSLDQAVLRVTLFPNAATLMMLSYGVELERVEEAAAELRAAFERLVA